MAALAKARGKECLNPLGCVEEGGPVGDIIHLRCEKLSVKTKGRARLKGDDKSELICSSECPSD